MIRSGTGILVKVAEGMFLPLAETADRRLEKIQRLTAVREAGGSDGN